MYNTYFGFKEAPFSIAPDPRYLYMTAQHREALAHLVYGLNNDGGCILLTGEVGTGKTTICRCLLEQIPEKVNIALLLNPKVSALELLETICDEFDIHYSDNERTIKSFTDRINRYLLEKNAANERAVLIIDEAQNLSNEVLEQIRLLTNLETEQRKLLQIIILGQPELLAILNQQDMRQLAQRITARYHLNPLNREEIKAYINHRLAVAGQNIHLFPDPVLNQLYKLSNGIPRLINIICDRALLGCYVENVHGVEPAILDKAANEVLGELEHRPGQKKNRWLITTSFLALFIALAITTTAMVYFYNQPDGSILHSPATNSSHPTESNKQSTTPVTGQTNVTESTGTAAAVVPVNQTGITPDSAKPQQVTPVLQPAGVQNMSSSTTPSIAASFNRDTALPHTQAVDIQTLTNTEYTDGNTETPSISIASATTSIQKVPGSNPAVSEHNPVDVVQHFIRQHSANSKRTAYNTLFHIWGIPVEKNQQQAACTTARSYQLRCLHKQGNMNSLLRHNRPAVLKLYTADGEASYLTLLAVKQQTATLAADDESIQLDLHLLDQFWLGQYTLLWKPPRHYNGPLKPGNSSELVRWLASSLQTLNGTRFSTETYDHKLVEAVKTFQANNQLTADGVVGPITIIHLNHALGMKHPTLR